MYNIVYTKYTFFFSNTETTINRFDITVFLFFFVLLFQMDTINAYYKHIPFRPKKLKSKPPPPPKKGSPFGRSTHAHVVHSRAPRQGLTSRGWAPGRWDRLPGAPSQQSWSQKEPTIGSTTSTFVCILSVCAQSFSIPIEFTHCNKKN